MKILYFLLQAILVLAGASSMDELDESTVERFEHYAAHPLKLNSTPVTKLLSSGLLSEYQVASLMDYRSRCGDVLSFSELSAVDGFGQKYAMALKEYVSLESSERVGKIRRDTLRLEHHLTGRVTCRADPAIAGGLKYSCDIGDAAGLFWGTRTTYSDGNVTPGTFSLEYFGRRLQISAGDFGMRSGQGLLLWSGFSMSGVGSASCLSRSGSGLYASHSYISMFRGAGVSFRSLGWTGIAAYSVRGPALVSVRRRFGKMDAGVNAFADGTSKGLSLDFRAGFGGGSVFGELAWSGTFAAVAGVLVVPSYGWMFSAQARFIPTAYASPYAGPVSSTGRKNDEYGISAAIQSPDLLFSLDASRRPGKGSIHSKALFKYSGSFGRPGSFVFEPGFRASVRYRPEDGNAWRIDLRSDLGVTAGRFSVSGRFNALKCVSFAWLSYAELGFSGPVSVCLRAGCFDVVNWDDRIYCYERDAPGNFSSVAFYGKGWNSSVFVSTKIGSAHKLYLRLSHSDCIRSGERRKIQEVRLQYSVNFRALRLCRSCARPRSR